MLAEKLLKPPSTVTNYIEDVFSTWLTSGTGAAQTVVNGNDLATKGGLIWEKLRGPSTQNHSLTSTLLGTNVQLNTNSSGTGTASSSAITSFNTDGFNFGTAYSNSGDTNVFWTFRKQPKFFTQGTYTGNGSTQAITHDLDSSPGCVIVKNITTAGSWIVWHRGMSSGYYIQLNGTGPQDNLNAARRFGNNSVTVNPTSTTITVGDLINTSGDTWIYFAFAHDAGGFGLNGTDNVISCGVYSGTGVNPGPEINLGYEPQFLLVKNITTTFAWLMYDNMRGMPSSYVNTSMTRFLRANAVDAEVSGGTVSPTATGFQPNTTYQGANALGDTYIYIAIRRGPMKTPTNANNVFTPVSVTTTNPTTFTTNFSTDIVLSSEQDFALGKAFYFIDKLRGSSISYGSPYLQPRSSNAQISLGNDIGFDLLNTQINENFWSYGLGVYSPVIYYCFKRSPNFVDQICYKGTGLAGQTFNHNLGVPPELWIIKSRDNPYDWYVGSTQMTSSEYVQLNFPDPKYTSTSLWNSTYPSSTVITLGYASGSNGSSINYLGYFFASCPGISKVGKYTGTGTLTTINCGFSGGARFVLIKRLDSSSDWFVWDTARGMVAGNDQLLYLNRGSVQTNANSVYTIASGFQLLASPAADVNTSGGTYLYLAIA